MEEESCEKKRCTSAKILGREQNRKNLLVRCGFLTILGDDDDSFAVCASVDGGPGRKRWSLQMVVMASPPGLVNLARGLGRYSILC